MRVMRFLNAFNTEVKNFRTQKENPASKKTGFSLDTNFTGP